MDSIEYKLIELPITKKLSNNFHLHNPDAHISFNDYVKSRPDMKEALELHPMRSYSEWNSADFKDVKVTKDEAHTDVQYSLSRHADFIIGFKSTIPVEFELFLECDGVKYSIGHNVNTIYDLKKCIPFSALQYSHLYFVFRVKNEDVEELLKSTFDMNYLDIANSPEFYDMDKLRKEYIVMKKEGVLEYLSA